MAHLLEIEQLRQSIWIDNPSRDLTKSIQGKVAIANAKVAYQEYKKITQTKQWQSLVAKGDKVQRLLWASTSTKNLDDSNVDDSNVIDVDELIRQFVHPFQSLTNSLEEKVNCLATV